MRTESSIGAWQGACDCHTHVFADTEQYPFSPKRTYTPDLADVSFLQRHLRSLKLSRVVVVQPSVYGLDNRATLHAIATLGKVGARGVAAINVDTITDIELYKLAAGGIRGIRMNFETDGITDANQAARLLRTAAGRIREHGWHIQIYARLALIAKFATILQDLNVPVVLDHYAGVSPNMSPQHPDFTKLLAVMQSGQIYVKLSAGHLCGIVGDNFAWLEPLARVLIQAYPDRLVWGSDWPHPDPSRHQGKSIEDIAPFKQVDDKSALAMINRCTPNAQILERIMVLNPAYLYGFEID